MPSRYGAYGPVSLPAASYDYVTLKVNLDTAIAVSSNDPSRDPGIDAAILSAKGAIPPPIPAPGFSALPRISPTSGDQTTTFTATDAVPTNGVITSRRWLLDDVAVGSAMTISNVSPGQLVLECTNTGLNGQKITSTSAAVTVIASAAAPAFSGKPTVSPTSGTTADTYTATDPTVSNGAVTAREWLLDGTVIGTAATIVPGSGKTGQLVRRVTAQGTNGATITTSSTAVTVSAVSVPAPAFSGKPTVSPTSGTTADTYTATDPTISNGSITAREWLLDGTVIGTGTTIVPGSGKTGSLVRRVSGTGTDGSTITTSSTAVTVTAASTAAGIPPNGVWNDNTPWDDTQNWKDAA